MCTVVNDVCNGVFVRERGDLGKGPKNCQEDWSETVRAGTVLPAAGEAPHDAD